MDDMKQLFAQVDVQEAVKPKSMSINKGPEVYRKVMWQLSSLNYLKLISEMCLNHKSQRIFHMIQLWSKEKL